MQAEREVLVGAARRSQVPGGVAGRARTCVRLHYQVDDPRRAFGREAGRGVRDHLDPRDLGRRELLQDVRAALAHQGRLLPVDENHHVGRPPQADVPVDVHLDRGDVLQQIAGRARLRHQILIDVVHPAVGGVAEEGPLRRDLHLPEDQCRRVQGNSAERHAGARFAEHERRGAEAGTADQAALHDVGAQGHVGEREPAVLRGRGADGPRGIGLAAQDDVRVLERGAGRGVDHVARDRAWRGACAWSTRGRATIRARTARLEHSPMGRLRCGSSSRPS